MQETLVRSLGQENPLERKWQPTPVFLPREFYGQRSLAGCNEVAKVNLTTTENTRDLFTIVNGVIMLFPSSLNIVTRAQAIVYCTCSVYPEENEAIVKKALEFQDHGIKVQPYR